MNKSKLKSYAPQARKDFIAAVTARANLLGLSEAGGKLEVAPGERKGDLAIIAGREWPAKVHEQRERLIKHIQTAGFSQTMEAVAYTWFNRFAALRYMEIHDYLDHGHRVLSNRAGGMPEILNHATELELPGFNKTKAVELKLAGNKDGELYKMLLVAQCNALSRAMPFLFERIDDETELLLPDNLLRTDSIIAKLVETIPEEDWQEVEIIGWLYQFYISEKKDEVIGKVVKSEDIPAATQLFTPNWIVQYLVQNSVGRLWLMANPASTLKNQWPYYIEPAEQTPDVGAALAAITQARMDEDGGSLNPESITVLDPACGSGHILVVAYDVLKAIYLERGYQLRAIPRLILEKNLYGLDIDDRAAQMAGFALLMKARADDRRLFDNPPKLNVLALQESKGLNADEIVQSLQSFVGRVHPKGYERPQGVTRQDRDEFADNDLFPNSRPQMNLGESVAAETVEAQSIRLLIDTFAHAKTFGSLIQIPLELNAQLATLADWLQQIIQNGDLYAKAAAQDLLPLVEQAIVLGKQFDAVVANPPYMGGKYLTSLLKTYLKENYNGFEKDLFSAFMIRDLMLTKESGQLGFMSPFVWMFILSYEELRQHLIDNATLTSLVQLEYSGFDGAVVPICTFTLSKSHVSGFTGSYIRLSDFRGAEQQGPKTLEAIQNTKCGWYYNAKPDDFKKIPGSPVAYWLSQALLKTFSLPSLSGVFFSDGLTKTGNNSKYLRVWWEVSTIKARDPNQYRTCFKGGDFCRYFGNVDHVVKWDEIARLHYRKDFVARITPDYLWDKEGITWTKISSASPSFRWMPAGGIAETGGPAIFVKSSSGNIHGALAFLNSIVATSLLKATSPTLNFQTNDVLSLPFYIPIDARQDIDLRTKELLDISMREERLLERSINFDGSQLTSKTSRTTSVSTAWDAFRSFQSNLCLRAKTLEEQNNRLFIEAYGLQDELPPEVPESQITLARADREKDCQRLISYAIGCMMGRYSLDEPGLIYAHAGNAGFDATRYPTFPADTDGIVPLTDELWFDDDAANRIREILLTVWGAETLEENMTWLAESLGKKGNETPDETIRRYLSGSFYKDHLQTYKKRPIYWLFSSGKQGAFQALVYLHRYHEGTLARMRSEYVVPLTGKIQSRIEMLTKDAEAATSTAARNKLNKEVEGLRKKYVELLTYDEKLRHYADMRIKLDLDDGVKVNYGKFGDLLAEVKAVTGGAGDE